MDKRLLFEKKGQALRFIEDQVETIIKPLLVDTPYCVHFVHSKGFTKYLTLSYKDKTQSPVRGFEPYRIRISDHKSLFEHQENDRYVNKEVYITPVFSSEDAQKDFYTTDAAFRILYDCIHQTDVNNPSFDRLLSKFHVLSQKRDFLLKQVQFVIVGDLAKAFGEMIKVIKSKTPHKNEN